MLTTLWGTMLTPMKNCPFCGVKVDVNDDDSVYSLDFEKTLWQAGHYVCGVSILGDTAEEAVENKNWASAFIYNILIKPIFKLSKSMS